MLRFIPLGGYLGAGKTTTMLRAAKRLESMGECVAVITNDQGNDLVDTQMARQQVGAVGEVTGGCFCCRFEELADTIIALRKQSNPTVVLAEAVGSCTDMQATVVRPLRAYHGSDLDVSPLTVLVDPVRYQLFARHWPPHSSEGNLAYLYRKQLEEADVIGLNKIDLLASGEVTDFTTEVQHRFPHAQIVTLSALEGVGLDELIGLWTSRERPPERRIDVDYNRYGTAEAELAWTNQVFELKSGERGKFAAVKWVDSFLASLGRGCSSRSYSIGHIKVRAWTQDGTTKASLASDEGHPMFDEQNWIETDRATITVNARVKCAPRGLELLLEEAIATASEAFGVHAEKMSGTVFSPGWPVPAHRI